MSVELAKAYVQIVPSMKGVKPAIEDEVGGTGAPAGNKFASIFKGAIAAAAIGATVKKSLEEGAAYEQLAGGVEKLFGKSADTVKSYADNAYATAQVSANTYMELATSFSASLLQSLGGDTKKAAESANTAINDMADNASIFGSDMQSIQNAYQGFAKQNYTMLDNLKLGYGGTKTEMQRLLADAGKLTGQKYDISNLNDVYEAIHAIQVEQGIAGNSASEASKTMEGSLNMLKASVSNFLASLATGGDVQKTTQQVVNATSAVIRNFIPALGQILAGLLPALGTAVINGLPKLLDSVGNAMSRVGDILANRINNMSGPGVARAVGKIASAIIRNIPKILGAVAKVCAALVRKVLSYFPIKIGKLISHIVTPKFDLLSQTKHYDKLGDVTVPRGIVTKWNAQGGIFDRASIIGYGVGEAGAEAILPLDTFWAKMDKIAQNQSSGTLNVIMQLDGQTIGQSSVDYINGQTIMFGASPVMI